MKYYLIVSTWVKAGWEGGEDMFSPSIFAPPVPSTDTLFCTMFCMSSLANLDLDLWISVSFKKESK